MMSAAAAETNGVAIEVPLSGCSCVRHVTGPGDVVVRRDNTRTRRGDVGARAIVRERRLVVVAISRRDCDHTFRVECGRVDHRVRAVVAGRSGNHHVVVAGVLHRGLECGRRVAPAEAHVDHLRAVVDGPGHALRDARREAISVRTEHSHRKDLRVGRAAESPDGVVRRRGDTCDVRPMTVRVGRATIGRRRWRRGHRGGRRRGTTALRPRSTIIALPVRCCIRAVILSGGQANALSVCRPLRTTTWKA